MGYIAGMRTRLYAPNRQGWTPDRRAAFLAALRSRQSVTAAAASVGMSRESAYWLRRQPEAADFRAEWEAATIFVVDVAAIDAIAADDPATWSAHRLARWLQRLTAREERADRAKVETS